MTRAQRKRAFAFGAIYLVIIGVALVGFRGGGEFVTQPSRR